MKKIFISFLLPTLVLCLFGTGLGQAIAGVKMPPFSLTQVTNGVPLESRSFKNHVLLITFFATWCSPCRMEIPTLIQMHTQHKKKGFSVLAFSIDEAGPAPVAGLIEYARIPYPVAMATPELRQAFGGITGVPTSFLVNRLGNVVKKYTGYVSEALLEKDISDLL